MRFGANKKPFFTQYILMLLTNLTVAQFNKTISGSTRLGNNPGKRLRRTISLSGGSQRWKIRLVKLTSVFHHSVKSLTRIRHRSPTCPSTVSTIFVGGTGWVDLGTKFINQSFAVRKSRWKRLEGTNTNRKGWQG